MTAMSPTMMIMTGGTSKLEKKQRLAASPMKRKHTKWKQTNRSEAKRNDEKPKKTKPQQPKRIIKTRNEAKRKNFNSTKCANGAVLRTLLTIKCWAWLCCLYCRSLCCRRLCCRRLCCGRLDCLSDIQKSHFSNLRFAETNTEFNVRCLHIWTSVHLFQRPDVNFKFRCRNVRTFATVWMSRYRRLEKSETEAPTISSCRQSDLPSTSCIWLTLSGKSGTQTAEWPFGRLVVRLYGLLDWIFGSSHKWYRFWARLIMLMMWHCMNSICELEFRT